jgi:ATP-binding cassette, subfamily B, bacterial PglK
MNFLEISKLLDILGKHQKQELYFLFFLIIISMFLEVFSIGLIIPVMMSILNQDISSLFPFIQPVIEYFDSQNNKELIIFTSIILVCSYFLKNLYFLFFLNVEGNYLSKIDREIKSRLFKKYISYQHYNYFKSNSSKLISNLTVDTAIVGTAVRSLVTFLAEITIALGIFALLFYFEPVMMLFNFFLILTGLLFFNSYSKKKIEDMSFSRKNFTDDLFLTLNNSFDSVKEINVFNKNIFFQNIFDKSNFEIFKINKKFHVIQGLPKIFYEFVGVFMLMILIIIMAITFKDTNTMLSFLALAGASSFRLIPSANRILNTYQYLGYAQKSILVISEELKKNNFKVTEINQSINFKDSVVFKNVSFKYDLRDNYVLKNINFRLKKPDKVLLYGETGVGKSTFIELLLGLLKPTNGSVEVENRDINLNFKEWTKNIGYIPQKVTLIDGSLLSNIAFGIDKKDIDHQLLKESIDLAEIETFISQLPNGLETNVGEFGSKLSGGQIQRIGIARAIYRNPEILILDEATNALDEITEQKVITKILKKFDNKILICISHNKHLLGKIHKKYKIESAQLVSI